MAKIFFSFFEAMTAVHALYLSISVCTKNHCESAFALPFHCIAMQATTQSI